VSDAIRNEFTYAYTNQIDFILLWMRAGAEMSCTVNNLTVADELAEYPAFRPISLFDWAEAI
jgi:hypothetical protein